MSRLQFLTVYVFSLLPVFSGCVTPVPVAQDAEARKLTVGLVQKEVRVGLSQPDVATALGSPNIVTRDSDGLETWIYDKMSTEARYETREGYGTILLLGGGSSQGASSSSQRTLTVVIKFDSVGKVKTFTFHASTF